MLRDLRTLDMLCFDMHSPNGTRFPWQPCFKILALAFLPS